MARVMFATIAAAAVAGTLLTAQSQTPFKLGTFERQGRTFVGVVVKDSMVVDLAAAHRAVTPASTLAAPTDMKDLIARYDTGLRDRVGQIVRSVTAASARPAYVFDLASLKTKPPVMYPMTILNAAVNYRAHGAEMERRDGGSTVGTGGAPSPGDAPPNTQSAPGIWQRAAADKRWNPYVFLKSPSAIVADSEAIRIPRGRTQIDWECELGVVVSKQARYVTAQQAKDHIFGYTMQMDISDRGGRGDSRYGSDWLIAKSHDTFAPMGPFITPKEFVTNPQNLNVKFTLNGRLMQDANTSLMIHDVYELLAYGSNIVTLRVGDIIGSGTPDGVGSARMPPIFLKAGDKTTCTYEGIGTLSNPVEGSI